MSQRVTEVNVLLDTFSLDGPRLISFTWPNGDVFCIKQVSEVREFPGSGTRYACRVNGTTVFLWHKNGKWQIYGDFNYYESVNSKVC